MDRAKYPKNSRLFESSYIIDDFISDRGATSQVYLVHREGEKDKKFAAKVVYRLDNYSDAYWKKFAEEEVTSLRIMNQEGLVQTYDSFSVDTADVKAKILIMEYVEGISLNAYLAQNGCIIPKVALNIFLKILMAIRVLHNYKHCIIHRDLKPENIILSKDLSKITILDFGVATVLENVQNDLEGKNIKCFTDDSGDSQGTFPYVIPDAGKKKLPGQETIATVQFDFFSLGVILYEMLMGERPYGFDNLPPGTSKTKKLRLPLEKDIYNISSNPTITPTIENMIFRCVACKPEDLHFRYDNIDQLIADCHKSIESLKLKEDNTPLLKPVNKRIYPKYNRLDPVVFKGHQKPYKHWSMFIIITVCALTVLIVALVVFFVL